jgi:outer membrane protein
LAQVMGHTGETIEVQTSVSSPEKPQQYFLPAEASLSQTTEYQLLDKQIEASKLQYRMAVGKNLPTVAIGAGYLYNDIMKSQANLVGMFTVSVPLSGWWGGSHDIKRQKLQVENAVSDKQRQSELLVIRICKAWNDMNDAYRQLDIARESIEQSEENLRLNTDYYEAGTSSISDVLDAQSLYQQSRDKYVEDYTNYEVKKREYLQATGR